MIIQGQNFGVEIEMTGITRKDAAAVIAEYYGSAPRYIGSGYDTYGATDRKGRTWKATSASGLSPQETKSVHSIANKISAATKRFFDINIPRIRNKFCIILPYTGAFVKLLCEIVHQIR